MNELIQILFLLAGYGRNKKGDQCIPICTECKHGECVAPEVCRCDPGFGGPACDISKFFLLSTKTDAEVRKYIFNFSPQSLDCPTGYWGRECSKRCDCLNNSTCDQANGVCNCAKGYIGEKCENKCPPDRFGSNCTEICRCNNGGSCHHISGECSCAAGFTGNRHSFNYLDEIVINIPLIFVITLQDHCVMKHAPLGNMVKSVDKSVSAKMMVNVIHKMACVIVPLAGRVMFVLIAVNLEHMVLIVKMSVNVITVAIVIMSRENVNVDQDSLVRNVWTVVRVTHSDSIVPKLVVVKIKRNVINRPVVVHALKVGPVLIVVKEIVPRICMDPTVKTLANAIKTIRICVIHGRVNVIVKLAGVAVFVIVHVHSSRTAKIARYPVNVKMVLNVHPLMVQNPHTQNHKKIES